MSDIEVIAPNLKRRLSGVTATIARLVPVQAGMIGIRATGPGLPPQVPHIPLWRAASLPRDRWRVWHARRNTEMLLGLALRHVLRRKYLLLFTSASQRQHSGYTKWLIDRMDALIATSARGAAYLDHPAHVIHHGIDTDRFAPASDRAALRARLGLPAGLLVGCFGRIRAQKGTGDFVQAMQAVLRDRPGVTALVMGRATEKHQAYLTDLRAQADKAGLADRILFLPEVPVDQIADWYAALDLFVAPQRWEGFGLTPLEAMACGVPVVATRVGAFEELIADPHTGTLVAANDPATLSQAIARWLDDPTALARAGQAARQHAVTNHAIEAEARALVALYRRMLDSPDGKAPPPTPQGTMPRHLPQAQQDGTIPPVSRAATHLSGGADDCQPQPPLTAAHQNHPGTTPVAAIADTPDAATITGDSAQIQAGGAATAHAHATDNGAQNHHRQPNDAVPPGPDTGRADQPRHSATPKGNDGAPNPDLTGSRARP